MLIPKAVIIYEPDPDEVSGRYIVETHWTGVELDRPCTGGISTGTNRKLAERLAAAINAGVVYTDPKVQKDVNGATYVQAGCKVFGRRLNADLKRLGF